MNQPDTAVVKCVNCQIAMAKVAGGYQCPFCSKKTTPPPELPDLPGLPSVSVAQDSSVTRQKRAVAAARAAFDAYAGMDAPELPEGPMARLQVELCRWEAREFGGGNSNDSVLGSNEEAGEAADAMIMLLGAKSGAGRMAKAILKRNQGIRGYDDPEKFRADLGDAFADMMIFGIQACTKSRMDFWTLLLRTAEDVMGRKWSENKFDGDPSHVDERPISHGITSPSHAGLCDTSLPSGGCRGCMVGEKHRGS